MTGKEYVNHNNELTIILDGDGDNYESFEKSVSFIRSNYSVEEKKYYSGFFDDALFHFEYQSTFIKVIFSGFMGTEIHVSNNDTDMGKDILREIASNILNFISNYST